MPNNSNGQSSQNRSRQYVKSISHGLREAGLPNSTVNQMRARNAMNRAAMEGKQLTVSELRSRLKRD